MKEKSQVEKSKNWIDFFYLWLKRPYEASVYSGVVEEIFALEILRLLAIAKERRILLVFANSLIAENQFHSLKVLGKFFSNLRNDFYFLPELASGKKNPTPEVLHRYSNSIEALCSGAPGVFFVSAAGLLSSIPVGGEGMQRLTIVKGQKISINDLCERLVTMNYGDEYEVSAPGEFARRGGIVDVYSPMEPYPVRIDFFGDNIESLRLFDPVAQRSIRSINEYVICTILEVGNLEKAENLTSPLDFFKKENTFRAIFHPSLCFSHIEKFLSVDELNRWMDFISSRERLILFLDMIESWDNDEIIKSKNYALDLAVLGTNNLTKEHVQRNIFEKLRNLSGTGHTLVIAAKDNDGVRHVSEALRKDLSDLDIIVEDFYLPGSYLLEEVKLALISEDDFFGLPVKRLIPVDEEGRIEKRHFYLENAEFFSDFDEGDYVVHNECGIGIFRGFEVKDFAGVEYETMKIEFADEVMVYVDMHKADQLSRYSGTGKIQPKLSSIDRRGWNRIKRAAAGGAANFAAELLKLQAMRINRSGFRFKIYRREEKVFLRKFPFVETPDQAKAWEEVRLDMESAYPMDRLVCGDAGYGKTEVAMRAVFKALLSGKQVAILVPTTILAQQHYYTFLERFSEYPYVIEMLSRFKTNKEQDDVIKRLAEGTVDVVIGTHRLLGKDIVFKDLGLLVVDEEQRFGVEHKERLKRFRAEVDIISMSATPIPRTLYMAMTGIRDMSIISTPPTARVPVLSYVSRYDEKVIKDAINTELERGGQVFYVHNRVKTINEVAKRLKVILSPDVRIGVAHGQMDEDELEEVMLLFLEGKIQVLCCTTIIESGIDVPNANTIIIERADRFGLAELYQLRGRVGRSNRQAYAYFLLPEEMQLTSSSRERISVIKKYSELGAGFRIALRDLEIRGSGNLIGTEQSGYINAIGFELYCHFLKMAAAELRGERILRLDECEVNLDCLVFGRVLKKMNSVIEAYIPRNYINADKLRYRFYRRICLADSEAKLNELKSEMVDRFGKLPKVVMNIFLYQELKIELLSAGFNRLILKGDFLEIYNKSKNLYFLIDGRTPRVKSQAPMDKIREIITLLRKKRA